MNRLHVLLHALFLIFALNSWAADCPKVTVKDFPKNDLPAAADRVALKGQESYKHYYGIGVPVDHVKARALAFIELETGDGFVFGGSSVLMMIYANGYGVKRDLDLCLRLQCNIDEAPAETQIRSNHLKKMKASKDKGVFDLCDDITSGYMMGHCSVIPSEIATAKRLSQFASLTKGWPKKDLSALAALQKAANTFFMARVENEVDLSGTARAMLQTEEEDSLNEGLKEALTSFEKGETPDFTEAHFQAADKELNEVYSKVTKTKELDNGTVEPAGIRAAQRKWIPYRDAWIKFGAVRYPKVPATGWKTWLTLERSAQLKYFLPIDIKLSNEDAIKFIEYMKEHGSTGTKNRLKMLDEKNSDR